METQKEIRRSQVGKVISDKTEKTIKVQVEGIYQHPRYKKYIKRRFTFLVHDPNEICHLGDIVRIEECRPISKLKKYIVREILEKATAAKTEVVKEVADDSARINP